MSYGATTNTTGFTYSSTSNKIAFDMSFYASSVTCIDEKDGREIESSLQFAKEYDVRELSGSKMVLGYSTQDS